MANIQIVQILAYKYQRCMPLAQMFLLDSIFLLGMVHLLNLLLDYFSVLHREDNNILDRIHL